MLLMAPFAPYLAHELWEMTGGTGSLLKAAWPKYDAALAKEEEIEIPVQINGKLRSRVIVPADADESFVLERALADDKLKAACGGKQIVKRYISRQDGESCREVGLIWLELWWLRPTMCRHCGYSG